MARLILCYKSELIRLLVKASVVCMSYEIKELRAEKKMITYKE